MASVPSCQEGRALGPCFPRSLVTGLGHPRLPMHEVCNRGSVIGTVLALEVQALSRFLLARIHICQSPCQGGRALGVEYSGTTANSVHHSYGALSSRSLSRVSSRSCLCKFRWRQDFCCRIHSTVVVPRRQSSRDGIFACRSIRAYHLYET